MKHDASTAKLLILICTSIASLTLSSSQGARHARKPQLNWWINNVFPFFLFPLEQQERWSEVLKRSRFHWIRAQWSLAAKASCTSHEYWNAVKDSWRRRPSDRYPCKSASEYVFSQHLVIVIQTDCVYHMYLLYSNIETKNGTVLVVRRRIWTREGRSLASRAFETIERDSRCICLFPRFARGENGEDFSRYSDWCRCRLPLRIDHIIIARKSASGEQKHSSTGNKCSGANFIVIYLSSTGLSACSRRNGRSVCSCATARA